MWLLALAYPASRTSIDLLLSIESPLAEDVLTEVIEAMFDQLVRVGEEPINQLELVRVFEPLAAWVMGSTGSR